MCSAIRLYIRNSELERGGRDGFDSSTGALSVGGAGAFAGTGSAIALYSRPLVVGILYRCVYCTRRDSNIRDGRRERMFI